MPRDFQQAPQQDFVLYDHPRPRGRSNYPNLASPSPARGQHDNFNTNQAGVNSGIRNPIPSFSGGASPAPDRLSARGSNSQRPSRSVSRRPPVPYFTHRTGSLPQSPVRMDIRDLEFEDFSTLASSAGMSGTAFSSPGLPTSYDVAGSSASSVTNVGTVSPQDLLVHEPYMSAPNSTALTALTSPSMYDGSPEFNDAFNMSPGLGSCDFDTGSNDPWFPLFPPEPSTEPSAEFHNPTVALQSGLNGTEASATAKKRKGASSSPGRHSSVAGVNSRRREKPLPPIIVDDPSDVVAMKRARNTLAARKSRERKAQRLEELEERILKLEQERDYWKRIAQERGDA